jgi:hypothetical protein
MTDISGYNVEFQTPQLGASQLNSATWTVVYYFYHNTSLKTNNFEWGNSTYPSQIQNFSWQTTAPVSPIGDGLTWISAIARKHVPKLTPWQKRFPKFMPRIVT